MESTVEPRGEAVIGNGWRDGLNPEYRQFVVEMINSLIGSEKQIHCSVDSSEIENDYVELEERAFEVAENELDYMQEVNTIFVNWEMKKWKAKNKTSPNEDNPSVPNFEQQNTDLLQEKTLHQHVPQQQNQLPEQQYLYQSQNSEFNQQLVSHALQEPGSLQHIQNLYDQNKHIILSQRGPPILPESYLNWAPTTEAGHAFNTDFQQNMNLKVYHILLQEIQEINQRLKYTTASIEDWSANQLTNSTEPNNITIRCSTKTVGPDPLLKNAFNPTQLASVWHLRLLIFQDYPESCPEVLGTIPAEINNTCCSEARKIFNIGINSRREPISVCEIARLWEVSCHRVVAAIAMKLLG